MAGRLSAAMPYFSATAARYALDFELNALLLGSRSADPHHGHKGMLCKIEFNDIGIPNSLKWPKIEARR
jgi:hypothetical protein